MKSLISVIIFSILIISCGFKPIYSSKNSNFEIIEINNKSKSKNSFMIEKTIMSISNEEANKKLKIELDYQKTIQTVKHNCYKPFIEIFISEILETNILYVNNGI